MSLNVKRSEVYHAKTAWALVILSCKDLAWVLTWEWALFIHVAKANTWELTQDTTVYTHWVIHVYHGDTKYYQGLIDPN